MNVSQEKYDDIFGSNSRMINTTNLV